MEEEQEMDATERSRKECNRHDGPMVAAFRSFADVVAVKLCSSNSLPLAPPKRASGFGRIHHL